MSQEIVQFELQVERGIAVDCNIDTSRQLGGFVNKIEILDLSIDRSHRLTAYIDQSVYYPEVEL